MRRWLTEETIGHYFRLAGDAKTADRERLAERERFWTGRLARIDDAWLLAGPQARVVFGGRLAHGRLGGCRPDQAALLLRIGGLTILEASHAAAETVWFAGNGFAPALFRPATDIYWLGSLNRCADYSSAFNHKNNDSWQTRLGTFLEQRSAH
jgi:hypothetical protein